MLKRKPLTIEDRLTVRALMCESVLFGALESDQLDFLLLSTTAVELAQDEVLFQQGRPATELFMLESGQIKLARLSPEGQEKVIDLIHPCNTFAEAVMFSGSPYYPVTATALSPSQLLCFEARAYTEILRQSTEACFAIMAQMSRRLHWQVGEIDRLTLHNATYRVIAYLLDQIPSTDLGGTSAVKLTTPKHIIASRLSMTPETLSRTLSKLGKEGLIDLKDDNIVLKDVGRLRSYIHGGMP